MRPKRCLIEVLALIGALLSAPAWALSSDRGQPIHIEADKVTIDDQKGVSTYQGHVRLTQGSTVITADRIMVYSDDNGPQRMVMTGMPATFRQRRDDAAEDVRGQARHIEHHNATQVTLLTGQAHFWRGKEEFTGDRIEYDARNDRVKALGAPDGDRRVRIVIQPHAKPGGAPPPEGKP